MTGAEYSPRFLMRTMSVLVHFTSRVQKDMELDSQVALPDHLDHVVDDAYASGAFHEVVPVRATKSGAESRPACRTWPLSQTEGTGE